MTLKEQIGKIDDNQVFYVGAKSGFLFGGTKKEFASQIDLIDGKISKEHALKILEVEQVYREICKAYSPRGAKARAAKARIKELKESAPLPLLDRQVLDLYERFTEKAINIVIMGSESGSIWSIKEGTEDWQKVAINYNADKLVEAVVKGVVESYKRALKSEIEALMKLTERLKDISDRSKSFERWFRSEDMAVLSSADPEYIIDCARDMLFEALKSKEGKQ